MSQSVAKFIFDYFSSRTKNSSTTKIDRLLQLLYQRGQSPSRSEVISYFRQLEDAGCGQYVEGRRGHPSRFEWFVNLTTVGQAAAGSTTKVEGLLDESDEIEDLYSNLLSHEYRLRPDLLVKFELPQDLSISEASRLAEFIKTLPFV
jgi:hypothetical protein